MVCVHGKTLCRPCERNRERWEMGTARRASGVRLPYTRHPKHLKPTNKQLALIARLAENRKHPTPETRAEASDLIDFLIATTRDGRRR